MSYNIYKPNPSGKQLVAANVSYRDAEIYRECSRGNCIIEDTANRIPENLEGVKCSQYGVRDESVMFSAAVVMGCCLLVPVIIVGALILQ